MSLLLLLFPRIGFALLNNSEVFGSIARSVVVVAVVGPRGPSTGPLPVSFLPNCEGVTATDEVVEAPVSPPTGNNGVDGGTVNIDGRAVDVIKTLGWLVISHGGTAGLRVLVVVS